MCLLGCVGICVYDGVCSVFACMHVSAWVCVCGCVYDGVCVCVCVYMMMCM